MNAKNIERRIKWLRTRAHNLQVEAQRCVLRREDLCSWDLFCEGDKLLAEACKLEGVPYTGLKLCEF